jgi:hypothetical protein
MPRSNDGSSALSILGSPLERNRSNSDLARISYQTIEGQLNRMIAFAQPKEAFLDSLVKITREGYIFPTVCSP